MRVYVNGTAVATLKTWTAVELRGVEPAEAEAELRVRFALVNPAGEEVASPPYNAAEQVIAVSRAPATAACVCGRRGSSHNVVRRQVE